MITYVTSFSPRMYEASGRKLVKSFINQKVEGRLLCTYDDTIDIIEDGNVEFQCLDQREDLLKFLEDNDDVIPEKLGGSAKQCRCKSGGRKYAKAIYANHVAKCPYSGWNFRASQWFRKLVSMKMFRVYEQDEILIWIDSDCIFQKRLLYRDVVNIFQDADMFFNYGRFRKNTIMSIETGLMGFRNDGFTILDRVYDKYITGAFRSQPRWDDSWMFTREVESKNREYNVIDLVPDEYNSSHVVSSTPLGAFIKHDKGSHHRTGVVEPWEK